MKRNKKTISIGKLLVVVSILLQASYGFTLEAFDTPIDFVTDLHPISVASADFNNDGLADVVTSNKQAGTVSVFIASGDDSIFLPRNDYATGGSPIRVITYDIDKDGILDLATANHASSVISVLLGNGDGTFQPKVDSGSAPYVTSLTANDFNGDGLVDIAMSHWYDMYISILTGNGDGTFQLQEQVASEKGTIDINSGDYNEDGKVDIAVSNLNAQSISTFIANGDATFQPKVDYGIRPKNIISIDFNYDGHLDIITPELYMGGVTVFDGDGLGSFNAVPNQMEGGFTFINADDYNLDGIIDVAGVAKRCPYANCQEQVFLNLGNGDGTIQLEAIGTPTGNTESTVNSMATGDFNGDGRPDVAIIEPYNHKMSILLNIFPVDLDLDDYDTLSDCNDSDPAINPGAAEINYNGIDENCNGMQDDNDADLDGYDISNDCDDNDPAINPGAAEINYNGIDENCNGMQDDNDADLDGYIVSNDCNDFDAAVNPGMTEIKHDGIDQNCNGYDLTIDIISAVYTSQGKRLTVEATSTLGQAALLNVDVLGALTWKPSSASWTKTFTNMATPPATVTVTGIEGSETDTVQ